MVIGIFGESCTGKSTLAEKIAKRIPCTIYTGKDYVRLSKNEPEARMLFREKMRHAVTGENILYVFSEREHLALLPEGAYRILATADIDTILERFTKRVHGHLPPPLEMALRRKHGCFDAEPHDLHVISGEMDLDAVCDSVLKALL